MATASRSGPDSLRTLNRVLAGWLGGSPETASDLDAALVHIGGEDDAPWDAGRLAEAARHILRTHAPPTRLRSPEIGVVDFRRETFDPLFARIRILDALAALPVAADPVLWITGLDAGFATRAGRRTARTVAEHLAARAFIEDIVLRNFEHARGVRLVFL